MFNPGDKVKLINKADGEIHGLVTVVEDKRSEIIIELDGDQTTFAHKAEFGGWKMLFYGLGGERCFSQRGPTYNIEKAT